eukprot:3940108-Rhodomonas_salina.1
MGVSGGVLQVAHGPGVDGFQWQCCPDRVARKEHDCAVAMLKPYCLVRVVSDGAHTVEPGHAQDGAHALEREDPARDVTLVLSIDFDSQGSLVEDLDQGSVREADGARAGDLLELKAHGARHVSAQELAVLCVVAEAVDDLGPRTVRGSKLHCPPDRTQVQSLCGEKVGTIQHSGQEKLKAGSSDLGRQCVSAEEQASGSEPEFEGLARKRRERSLRSGVFTDFRGRVV